MSKQRGRDGIRGYFLNCKFLAIGFCSFVLNHTVIGFLHFHKFFKTTNKILVPVSLLIIFSLLQGAALSQSIPFETIDKGEVSYFRYGDPDFSGSEMVIRDWKPWKWFWAKHTEGIQPQPPILKVDFRTEMVLVVILGYQTSGGGPSIEISSVEEIFRVTNIPGKRVRVLIQENKEPGPLDVITNPYHIVKMPKSISIIFEHETMKRICTDNSQCGNNFFCLFPEGQCSGSGKCMWKPEACITLYMPVCGCDIKTYGNQCEAYANGVSIIHTRKCKEVTQ